MSLYCASSHLVVKYGGIGRQNGFCRCRREIVMKEEKKFHCPVEATLSVIGGKYKSIIDCILKLLLSY